MSNLLPLFAAFDPHWILSGAVFLIMISVLVAAHEYGHFLLAKLCGMGVEEFAIGFGKRPVYARRPKARTPEEGEFDPSEEPESKPGIPPREPGMSETVYTIRPWPLGGFVRIKGMMPEEDGSETRVHRGFYSRPAWQRFLVLLAGPVFSLAFGVILLAGTFMAWGVVKPLNEPVLGPVVKGEPAATAGLLPGDRILTLGGVPVATFYDLVKQVRDNQGTPVEVVYERQGEQRSVTLTPKVGEAPTPVRGPDLEFTGETRIQARLGVLYDTHRVPLSFQESMGEALMTPVRIGGGLVAMFARPAEIKDNVGGPGTIVAITNEAAREGLETVLRLSALLSISLGFMNLLPIPPFDGGQMMIALAEMLRRNKRLPFKLQNAVMGVGFALVVLMMVSILWVDVERLFLKKAPQIELTTEAPAEK